MSAFFCCLQKEFSNISNHIFVGKMVLWYLFEQLYPKLKICHKLANQKKYPFFFLEKAMCAAHLISVH